MLEKLGLPAKPSMRGGNWVVDASHCQSCSSQFTFINRKHHCRRCGGLFCNNCTLQRMVLRGQGDSPVRICDPCKKLEEAARFELRYGHKKQTAKGMGRQSLKQDDEVLQQILGNDGKLLLSRQDPEVDLVSDIQRSTAGASSSSREFPAYSVHEESMNRSKSVDLNNGSIPETGPGSPEDLRNQAAEEKNKYKILKAEGKKEDALQAFKRAKELERQAGSLEIALRKNRRIASKVSYLSNVSSSTQKNDDSEEIGNKHKSGSRRSKETKDDLAAELKELGWSDADLHSAEKKSSKLSVEGELSNLLGEVIQKSAAERKTGGIDKSEVNALKRKALALKREGKLAEAKEELKKAKILERQLEEQELLGQADDSDDELMSLIQSMDDDKQDEFSLDGIHNVKFDNFTGLMDDLPADGNFEVTDDDMNDPDLAAALKSFGWNEEDDDQVDENSMQSDSFDKEALQTKVLALKREAVSQKRAGKIPEAMELLKKAKLLEKDLENMGLDHEASPEFMPESSVLSGPSSLSGHQLVNEGIIMESQNRFVDSAPKSKIMIQKELLAIKKRSLVLRREGRIQEAEEELKKGKVLEQQLEELESAPKKHVSKVSKNSVETIHLQEENAESFDLGPGIDAEVTEQDMEDPALLSVLKDLGWNDVDNMESVDKRSVRMDEQVKPNSLPSLVPRATTARSKAEIQKELLAIKRKALAYRRQGKNEEAEEELEKAKLLEKQMTEIEASSNANFVGDREYNFADPVSQTKSAENVVFADGHETADSAVFGLSIKPTNVLPVDVVDVNVLEKNDKAKGLLTHEKELASKSILNDDLAGSSLTITPTHSISLHEEVIVQKQGLPHQATDFGMPQWSEASDTGRDMSGEAALQTTSRIDAVKHEVLLRKKKAVALKREGKLAEAREELRQAKVLEKSLEDSPDTTDSASENVPTSFSHATSVPQQMVVHQHSSSKETPKPLSSRDRFKIQQESLAHKRNALKLRREGKLNESEAEFELAKALEKQLEEIDQASNSHSDKSQAADDVMVEDLLDPQLLSALKSIGIEGGVSGANAYEEDSPQKLQKGGSRVDKARLEEPAKPDKQSHPQSQWQNNSEKSQLEEQIKAEKLRALNLKRAGKQAEALEALRSAKRLEKKLELLV